uniref:D(4) dopamine receptor-like n=1 Tax=Echeneis naucrates TaxID=173247 RepID=A0A665UWC0_ECHNA
IPPAETHLKDYNYLALVLGVPLILVIILGNVLVCLSVLTERSLKTATNYFIISLAVADLLLAVLVLPLFMYSEVSFLGGIWTLSTSVCDALMTMDVMLCTASILNLCAISVDRYIAVVIPLKYNRNQFSLRQLGLITASWVLSVGVASPVIFGLNQVPGRNPNVCRLEDERFVIYSSICSFFVPCPVMLFLYYGMFRGLRRWSRGGRSRVGHPTLPLNLSQALQRTKVTGRPEKEAYTTSAGLSPTSLSTISMTSVTQRSRSRSRVSGRERKAMKVLPMVVGEFILTSVPLTLSLCVSVVFLACWMPFFIIHVTKVLCSSCNISPTLISVVTWLGYFNSAVNPIIYTAFNPEFRKFFQKLLCCQT